jgi:hypothetical protein
MNGERVARELVRLARAMVSASSPSVREVAESMEHVAENTGTDYGGMKLESIKKREDGDSVVFGVSIYFSQLASVHDYDVPDAVKDLWRRDKTTIVQAFKQAASSLKDRIFKTISEKMEQKPPLFRFVGQKEMDNYDDVRGKVVSISLGDSVKTEWGQVLIDGRVEMEIEAKKLPSLASGVYNEMSDAQLKKLVQKWGSDAPEDFWMDGEYRGTAASRVRDIMRRWREMPPRQQQKHYEELMRA